MVQQGSVIAIAVLLLSGCGHLDNWRVYDRFDGIRNVYETAISLDILTVHGMGHAMSTTEDSASGYSLALQAALARNLGLPERPVESLEFPIANGAVRLGTLVRTTYVNPSDKKTLTVFELSWAEAVKPIKTVLLELDGHNGYRETTPLEVGRAKLNSVGKAFVNTHLADPVIYSGEFGVTLRAIVAQAVCLITRKSPPRNAPCDFNSPTRPPIPLAIITESLGSALVFDTLNDLFTQGRERAGAAVQVAGATTQMYMFANQIPLLELRALRTPSNENWLDAYPCPAPGKAEAGAPAIWQGIRGFLEIRRAARGPAESAGPDGKPLSVVAFSDQNDLLTYFISDRFKKHCSDIRFANVAVTNASALWFFVAVDPLAAHTGYITNEKVIQMVIEGGAP